MENYEMTKGDFLSLGFIIIVVWIVGSIIGSIVPALIGSMYSEQGIVSIVKEYEGHGSPFAILDITSEDMTRQITVNCDYYQGGEQVTLRVNRPSKAWFLWPFLGFDSTQYYYIENLPRGC